MAGLDMLITGKIQHLNRVSRRPLERSRDVTPGGEFLMLNQSITRRYSARRPRVSVRCSHCGVDFKAKQCRVDSGGGKYCSDPCRVAARSGSLSERFFAKVVAGRNGCQIWVGAIGVGGYGRFNPCDGRSMQMAHRVALELAGIDIHEGLHVDHLCRNRKCVNVAHLEPVTQQENNRRGLSHSAVNARKTQCIRGHELSGPNVYITPLGKRNCRACRNIRRRKAS